MAALTQFFCNVGSDRFTFVLFKYFNATSKVKPTISHPNGFHLFLFLLFSDCCIAFPFSCVAGVPAEYCVGSTRHMWRRRDHEGCCERDQVDVYCYVASPHMLDTTHNTPYAFRGMDSLAFFGDAEAFASKPMKRDRKFAKNIRDVVSQFASGGRVQGDFPKQDVHPDPYHAVAWRLQAGPLSILVCE